jgi:hypothetical protein
VLEADGPADKPAIEALIAESERLIASGKAPTIAALESIPWDVQWRPRLELTADFVRRAAERANA